MVATALIRLLSWEPPYAVGVALEKTKKKIELLQIQLGKMKSYQGMLGP